MNTSKNEDKISKIFFFKPFLQEDRKENIDVSIESVLCIKPIKSYLHHHNPFREREDEWTNEFRRDHIVETMIDIGSGISVTGL